MSEYYDNYQENLSILIFEKSNREIPKQECDKLAKNATNRKRYLDSKNKGNLITMDDYAGAEVWAYFQ